jgi:hypothetical protein
MIALTARRLKAIIEALHLRLAGEIDTDIPREDYENALGWAEIMLRRKQGEDD